MGCGSLCESLETERWKVEGGNVGVTHVRMSNAKCTLNSASSRNCSYSSHMKTCCVHSVGVLEWRFDMGWKQRRVLREVVLGLLGMFRGRFGCFGLA
jgi:hypothetical protein